MPLILPIFTLFTLDHYAIEQTRRYSVRAAGKGRAEAVRARASSAMFAAEAMSVAAEAPTLRARFSLKRL